MGLSFSLSRRRKKVLDNAWNLGFTAVLATAPENIFYLSGYWGEGFLFLDRSESYLIVPKLEFERASASAVDIKLIKAERGQLMYESLAGVSKGHKVCTDGLPADKFIRISDTVKGIAPKPEVFYEARKFKDEDEINRLLKGGVIMDRLFSKAAEVIRPGVTEQFVAAEITAEMMRFGANPVVYYSTTSPVIVASGPNSAYPHAEPSDRVIRRGDFVVVDIVLRYEGYVVDGTRTFHLGRPTEEEELVYMAVKEAQEKGMKALSLGISFGEVDEVCRSSLKELARFFVHSTGHGIGLEVHEPPWIGPGRDEKLKSGMAFTIEPGVYLPKKFGVRIEDSVIMLDRPLPLTKYTKSLKEL